jgi:[acyl-carrier-protein] S-malonyltransferase
MYWHKLSGTLHTMSFAFVFPGQASQSVGMLASHSGTDPVVRATFDEASGVLGYDLWHLVQEGPTERLNTTEYTQPAMLAAGIATARLWARRKGGEPAAVAGHSLGEFTALVCAGALDFSTTIALVKFRGQVMQEAVPAGAGAMAVVLGLEDADVEAVCREAAQGGVVEAVNFNSQGQVAIAGETAAVQRAIEVAKAKGAKRAMTLPVSVPSHSSLMNGAAERFAKRLADVEIRAPHIRYISAVDAAAHAEPSDIRALLGRQLARPVRWPDTVRALAAAGVGQIIECGPGKVLMGLNKRVGQVTGVTFAALEDPASLDAALAATKGAANA